MSGNQQLNRCPTPAGVLYGVAVHKHSGVQSHHAQVIPCSRWACPVCRQRKGREFLARALRGEIAQAAKRDGFREQYNFKLLTLTCGGTAYHRTHTPEQAAIEMRNNFCKLRKALREAFGKFHFLRVMEDHLNGYPHYHVLLVGPSIAPKEILQYIRNLWIDVYGMGYVDIRLAKSREDRTIAKAIQYCLSYLFEEPAQHGNLRILASSKGALEPPRESDWEFREYNIAWVDLWRMDPMSAYDMLDNMTPDRIEVLLERWCRRTGVLEKLPLNVGEPLPDEQGEKSWM